MISNVDVLFWNINRKKKEDDSRPPIQEAIAHWADSFRGSDYKIIGLAECTEHWAKQILHQLQDLNPNWRGYQTYRNYLTCFYLANHAVIEPEPRIINEVAKHILPLTLTINGQRYLLIFVHLFSKITVNQDYENQAIVEYLLDYERKFFEEESIQNYRTIVAGDLNYNPFDPFLNHIPGSNPHFNRSRQFYLKTSTLPNLFASWEKSENNQDYFYNPSWKLLQFEPFGLPQINFTHTFNELHGRGQTDRSEQYFNLYDQVLLRPKMYVHFHERDLKIVPYWFSLNQEPIHENVIENILNHDLLPYSDHFAIQFRLIFAIDPTEEIEIMTPSQTTAPQLPETGFKNLQVKEDVIYQAIDLFAKAVEKDTGKQVLVRIFDYTYEENNKGIEKTYIFEIIPANYRLLAVELFRVSFKPNTEELKECLLSITRYPDEKLLKNMLPTVVNHEALSAPSEDKLKDLLTDRLLKESKENNFWKDKVIEAIASVRHSSKKGP